LPDLVDHGLSRVAELEINRPELLRLGHIDRPLDQLANRLIEALGRSCSMSASMRCSRVSEAEEGSVHTHMAKLQKGRNRDFSVALQPTTPCVKFPPKYQLHTRLYNFGKERLAFLRAMGDNAITAGNPA
jgi:hypothetical protein